MDFTPAAAAVIHSWGFLPHGTHMDMFTKPNTPFGSLVQPHMLLWLLLSHVPAT
jgi:hypothetical protein